MNIPRPIKLVLLALTLWQPLYILAFMVFMFTGITHLDGMTEHGFQTMFTIHMATAVTQMALLVFYIVHVFKARTIAGDKRALWGIALFCGAPIAMPIYFFAHVWPQPAEARWAIDNVVR